VDGQREPRTLNSWGFNVALAAACHAAGLPGVALACATLVAAIGALVLVLARQPGASPVVSGWLLLPCSPLLSAQWQNLNPAGAIAAIPSGCRLFNEDRLEDWCSWNGPMCPYPSIRAMTSTAKAT